MKKVYSLSFFRDPESAYESPRCGASQGRFFANFLPVIVRAFRSIFAPEGWILAIHHDNRVLEFGYFKVLEKMAERGMLVMEVMGESQGLCKSMLWRMLPIFKADGHVVCRDLDSLPSVRELEAVNRWIYSGLPVSALHDSISHRGTALMGGMVGFDTKWFKAKVAKDYAHWCEIEKQSGIDLRYHGSDQALLHKVVWPLLTPEMVMSESRESLGPLIDLRDQLSAHIGGAFHALPAQQWYDANMPDKEILEIEKEVLG